MKGIRRGDQFVHREDPDIRVEVDGTYRDGEGVLRLVEYTVKDRRGHTECADPPGVLVSLLTLNPFRKRKRPG